MHSGLYRYFLSIFLLYPFKCVWISPDDNASFVCYEYVHLSISPPPFYSFFIILPIRPLPPVSHRSDSKRRLDLQNTGRIEAKGSLGAPRRRQYSRLPPESNRALLCRYSRVSAVSLSPLLRRVEGSFHPHPPGWNRTHGAGSSGL
jgi:hypothetical protein